MTIDEFKSLKKGDFLEYPGMPPSEIILVDHQYNHSTEPATRETFKVTASNGRVLRLSDPPEWIEKTLAHKQLILFTEE